MPGRQFFMLEPRDPVLYMVQRSRDEAHRFAIGTHRAKRAKSIGVNPLDEIPGVGPTRKRALMNHFGRRKRCRGRASTISKSVDNIFGGAGAEDLRFLSREALRQASSRKRLISRGA